jgi:tetratricopeptide (TPR) repeat protein
MRKSGVVAPAILAARTLAAVAAVLAIATGACTTRMVTAPMVAAPKFPEFVQPPVTPALAADPAAPGYDRGWRFLQADDLRNADREFAAALHLSPAFYPAEAASGYLDLARKDPKAALAHFDRALGADAAYASALVGRGEALLALNREPEAIAAFDAAVVADASLGDVRRRAEVLRFRNAERNLATARELARSGKFDEAARTYQGAIATSPDSAFLYRELGAVERQIGDGSAALASFRKAVELDPGDAASFAQIGELLEAAGDRDGALAAYNQSLMIEPGTPGNPINPVQARRAALLASDALARLPEAYRAIATAPQVARADLAALIGVRLGAELLTMRPRDPGVVTDVRNNWAETWIMAVTRAGVMEPFANHTFQPRTIVRRSDLAQAVSRLLDAVASPAQLPAWQAARPKFADLVDTHLAYSAASVAVASGVMTAGTDGSFQPSRAVTGAEAVQSIDRLQQMAAARKR